MNCKICESATLPLLKRKVLGKYEVNYFRCNSCGFLQTEEPYWLKEAYAEAISAMDVGLVYRNQELVIPASNLINHLFGSGGRFLDYGGGLGLFTRMMRDRGFDFFRQDLHCENIFAKSFDLTGCDDKHFDLLTAFEVFEHLEHPREDIRAMLEFANVLFFSTEIQPESGLEDWWYLTPESGQHISFYSLDSLRYLAAEKKCHFYSNGFNLHLFSKTKLFLSESEFRSILLPQGFLKTGYLKILKKLGFRQKNQRTSRMMTDFDTVRSVLIREKSSGS